MAHPSLERTMELIGAKEIIKLNELENLNSGQIVTVVREIFGDFTWGGNRETLGFKFDSYLVDRVLPNGKGYIIKPSAHYEGWMNGHAEIVQYENSGSNEEVALTPFDVMSGLYVGGRFEYR